MPPRPRWEEYQDEVSVFLSQLGFDVTVDETIRGARTEHKIDVTARMSIAGLDQCWLIECKSWKRRVPKERVLTFLGVVEDIGADRGLLFSESGFQAGAIYAAQNTNIALTSLADFENNFPAEVSSARAKVLDERIAGLMQAFAAVWDLPDLSELQCSPNILDPPDFQDFLKARRTR